MKRCSIFAVAFIVRYVAGQMVPGCTDSDNGAHDAQNAVCWEYVQSWCDQSDDADFTARTMCCACGGGSSFLQKSPGANSPVGKIISLLEGLAAKSEEEGKKEALSYEKFEYWCTNSEKALNKAIKKSEETIVELESKIEGLEAEEETLTAEIATLTQELTDLDTADAEAKHERGEEAKLYRIADKDLSGTITAIDNAMSALETSQQNIASASCENLDLVNGAQKNDKQNAVCLEYVATWCGQWDDADFTANDLCCACGGGAGFLQIDNTHGHMHHEDDKIEEKVRYALALASSQTLNSHQQKAVFALLQTNHSHSAQLGSAAGPSPAPRPNFAAAGAQAAHVKKYSFKSGAVVELLKELKKKFEDDELQNTKEETNAINAYELAKEARDDSRDAKTKSKKAKSNELTDVQNDLSTSRADLLVVQGDLQSDKNLLDQTLKDCALMKTEWEQRSLVREQELEAISAAIKILSKATKLRTEAPTNPVPPPSPVFFQKATATLAFLQLDPMGKAVQILRKEARAQHSKALDLLAQQISVGGPFSKVNNMIEKMIFRLMDEQKNEDTHKAWCDKELSTTNTSLEHKQDKIDDLNAKIATEKGREATLTREIIDDEDMIAVIVAHVTEATEIRKIGKKENALAVKDAKQAQAVLADAIAVIENFYKESGMLDKEAWEFVQQGQAPTMVSSPVTLPSTPATWSSSYTGVEDPSAQPKGVVSVLKATSADFATMEADTLAQEATDQAAFEDDMKAAAIEKAGRETGVEMRTNEKKRVAAQIAQLSAQLKDVSEQHEATQQYLDDLQPACVQGGSTYDDRKAARAKEIEALHQAQNILANAFNAPGPAAAFVQAAAPAAAPASFLQKKRR